MGTFLPLDDLDPTLSDVLAFINDFDNSDSSQDSLTSSPSEDDPVASSSEATAKRKKSRAAASRRFQHKKKAELLALRAQASSLKKRLKELSDNGNGSKGSIVGRLDGTQTQKLVAMWLGKAQLEKHLRLTAETENRQLKRALARQKYTAKVVGHLLHNVTSVVHIEEGLRTPHPSAGSGLDHFVPNLDDAIYSELASRMSNLYLNADGVFSSPNAMQTRFLTDDVEIRWDPISGVPYVELRASMPIQLSIQDTASLAHNTKALEKSRYRKYQPTEHGLRKESEVELQNEVMTMSVNVMSLSRTYEESNRVLITWTSLVCDHPLDPAVQFREQETQQSVHFSESNREMDSMTIFVLQKLGSVTRQHLMDMGNAYLDGQGDRASPCNFG
ncbi:hypothetical protein PRNP1_012776 [Phytophthora ramorum]